MLRRICLLQKRRYATKINSLPFKVTPSEASQTLINNQSLLEKTVKDENPISNNNLPSTELKPLQKKYLPFHTADINNMISSYSGKLGRDRVEYYWTYIHTDKSTIPVQQCQIVTDWYNCYGTLSATSYSQGTLETQIYADFKYPRAIVESVMRMNELPRKKNIITPKDDEIIDSHNMNMSFALEKIISTVHKQELKRAEKHILSYFKADRAKVDFLDLHLNTAKINLFSYHLPAYIYTTNSSDVNYYKIVNGLNKQYDGETKYSLVKTSLLGSSIGFLVGVVAFTNPSVRLANLVIPIFASTSVGAFLVSSFYKVLSSYNISDSRSNMNNEKDYNSSKYETDDDRNRKNGEDINAEGLLYPEDECRILGLNPTQPITMKQLKDAYFKQIKQWHPDVAPVDTKIATQMSIRIREAFEVLKAKVND